MMLCGLWHSCQSWSLVLSSRHWNRTLLALSFPLKRNVATSSLVVAGGPERSWVLGGSWSDVSGAPSQRTLKHCIGLRSRGLSGPMFPCALFPPPSTFTRPLLPSLAHIPQVPLSLAVLPVIVWLTLGTKMPYEVLLLVRLRSITVPEPAPISSATVMPVPSLWLEGFRRSTFSRERSEISMPLPWDSLASLYSSRFSLELFSTMPDLFERTSLPRRRLSRAWKSEMPGPLDRCATLSISWLRSSGEACIPFSSRAGPLTSSIVLRSTTLSWDGSPTAAPLSVTPISTPPPLSVSVLPTTVLPLEPWIATASLAVPSMTLSWSRLPCDRSIQTPSFPFAASELSRITVPCVSLVSQIPWSFAWTELLRSVLPLTADLNVGGGGGGVGWNWSAAPGGNPRAMPPSWLL